MRLDLRLATLQKSDLAKSFEIKQGNSEKRAKTITQERERTLTQPHEADRLAHPLFTVVIVNYNGGEYLQAAVDSLAKQSFQDFELIVVDNASEDNSLISLKTQHIQSCRIEKLDKNVGFAAANNIAAQMGNGEWLALLNPDAVAEENWLMALKSAIDSHPDCKVFASCQISVEDLDMLDGAGDSYLAFGFPWQNGKGHRVDLLPDDNRECFSPSGASAVYFRHLFLSLGGFDERFFCYCEDVDLGFRLQRAGETCTFVRQAVVLHHGSALTERGSYFTLFHGTRNSIWVYLKNSPLWLLVITLPGHLFIHLYIYVRNKRGMEHSGMWDGLVEGYKRGFGIRRSSDYNLNSNISIRRVFRTMAFNPYRMVRHRIFLR